MRNAAFGMPGMMPMSPMTPPATASERRWAEELHDHLLAHVLRARHARHDDGDRDESSSEGTCATRPSPIVSSV